MQLKECKQPEPMLVVETVSGELSTAADIFILSHSFTSSSGVYIYKHMMIIVAVTHAEKFELAWQQHSSSKKMSS